LPLFPSSSLLLLNKFLPLLRCWICFSPPPFFPLGQTTDPPQENRRPFFAALKLASIRRLFRGPTSQRFLFKRSLSHCTILPRECSKILTRTSTGGKLAPLFYSRALFTPLKESPLSFPCEPGDDCFSTFLSISLAASSSVRRYT